MRYFFPLVISFILSSLSAEAKNIHFINVSEHSAWENIISICKKKNTPLFVKLEYDGAAYKTLDKFEENNKDVKFVNQHFVSLKISYFSNIGESLVNLFQFEPKDAYLIFNTNEILLLKSDTISRSWFESGIERIIALPELNNKFEANSLSKEEWVEYLELMHYNLGYFGSINMANSFISQLVDNDLSNPRIWPFITRYCLDLNNVVFKTIRDNPSLVNNDKAKFPWKEFYVNSYNLNLSFAINNKDTARLSNMIQNLVPLYPDSAQHEAQELLLKQQYYGALNEWKQYQEITLAYLEDQDSVELYVEEYNNVFYNYPYNKISSFIEKLLLQGIELESNFELNYMLGEHYMIKSDFEKAFKYLKEANKKAANNSERLKAMNLLQYLME